MSLQSTLNATGFARIAAACALALRHSRNRLAFFSRALSSAMCCDCRGNDEPRSRPGTELKATLEGKLLT
jgi:hypothetical protein